MPTLAYFFYELPHNTGLDAPDTLILSGYRIKGTPRDVYPFGIANTYRLDDRSQALIGQKNRPRHRSRRERTAGDPDPVPVVDDSQLCFDFNALTAGKAKPKPEPRFMPHGMNTVDSN